MPRIAPSTSLIRAVQSLGSGAGVEDEVLATIRQLLDEGVSANTYCPHTLQSVLGMALISESAPAVEMLLGAGAHAVASHADAPAMRGTLNGLRDQHNPRPLDPTSVACRGIGLAVLRVQKEYDGVWNDTLREFFDMCLHSLDLMATPTLPLRRLDPLVCGTPMDVACEYWWSLKDKFSPETVRRVAQFLHTLALADANPAHSLNHLLQGDFDLLHWGQEHWWDNLPCSASAVVGAIKAEHAHRQAVELQQTTEPAEVSAWRPRL